MQTREVVEGETRLVIPALDPEAEFPPGSAEVFYNPRMELSRDIGVAAYAILGGESYVDALAASGARGIRIANEVGNVECVVNDWNPRAYDLIRENIRLNDLGCEATRKNANVLLHERRFDVVDLDPFGSPAPFLDAASASANQTLAITATDTAPLCGAHLNSGIRKYAARPLKTEYHPEMAVRILLGAVARHLARHEKSTKPLFSQATSHFIRLYVAIDRGAKRADESMGQLGFIAHCFSCGHRWWKHGLAVHLEEKCPTCEERSRLAGPLWLGDLHDHEFLGKLQEEVSARPLNEKKRAARIIGLAKREVEVPTYYEYHEVTKRLGISPGPIDHAIHRLREMGYEASRTHFTGTSIKTNADITTLKKVVSEK